MIPAPECGLGAQAEAWRGKLKLELKHNLSSRLQLKKHDIALSLLDSTKRLVSFDPITANEKWITDDRLSSSF